MDDRKVPCLARPPIIISVEANIAAGKSTLLKMLADDISFEIIEEPVKEWSSHLALYYSDPKRWGFTFQELVSITRSNAFCEERVLTTKKPCILTERSIFTDEHCFTRMLIDDGILTPDEQAIRAITFDFVRRHTFLPDGYIYLRASPETCYQRMKKRARDAEKTVSLAYLKKLHEAHENWLITDCGRMATARAFMSSGMCPILEIDAEIDFEHSQAECDLIKKQIMGFVETCRP